MKRSAYSLVLMEDVVEAIDTLAYSMNTSRSNLINQILAEKVALITPEMQMKNIFDTMTRLLDGHSYFQIKPQAATSMISIKSILRYKYNPTIRYAVTLNREKGAYIGDLKMISRTQSDILQKHFSEFFMLWSQYEKEVKLKGWSLDQTGKWTRELYNEVAGKYNEDILAQAIVSYIKAVDEGIKLYCGAIEDTLYAQKQLYKHFSYYITHEKLLV